MSFRDDFVWGAATASYQIEGAAFEDGKGPSVWDMLCRKPGAVFKGHTGDVACDHYHRYAEDVALMKTLGLKGYRLSLSWPRIMPHGEGAVNEKGLEFYDRLVDELLSQGIQPWVTLFHWDYPLALYRKGGWLNPDSPKWFADYTEVVVDRLSDRVTHWFTQNEPQCYIGLGHWTGIHAPGDKLRWAEILLAAHHSMLAHGLSVQVIRNHARKTPMIGAAPVGSVTAPATDSAEDIEAARTHMFSTTKRDPFQNAWWMDPILKGEYPADMLEAFKGEMPDITAEDLKTMNQPLDFFGMNTYSATIVKAGANGPEVVEGKVGEPMTAFRWTVNPQCMYWGPKFFFERYGLPIVVTENGMSSHDWVMLDGSVRDEHRVDFLHRHLLELKRAAQEVPVHGYFQWSLLDNFEWAEGYKERFGIVHVDYETLKRTPKSSYYWYQGVIATNGNNL